MDLERSSMPRTKRTPENGQPCLTPRCREKKVEALPLFRTQLVTLLQKIFIHDTVKLIIIIIIIIITTTTTIIMISNKEK